MEGSGRVPWLENSPVSEVWLYLLQSSDPQHWCLASIFI